MNQEETEPEKMTALRRIVSFVRREGRLTRGQSRALEELWPVYGVEYGAPVDLQKLYGNDHPVVFEIGFGMGRSFVEMAAADPDENYLGT